MHFGPDSAKLGGMRYLLNVGAHCAKIIQGLRPASQVLEELSNYSIGSLTNNRSLEDDRV